MEFAEEGVDYGMCYHSHEAIHSLFGTFLEILAIKEGVLGAQDLIVLKKINNSLKKAPLIA